jgi:hypothetical protein
VGTLFASAIFGIIAIPKKFPCIVRKNIVRFNSQPRVIYHCGILLIKTFLLEIMFMNSNKIILAVLIGLLTCCANPSITNVDKVRATNASSGSIYVARFEGNPDFVEEATDMFVLHLEQQTGQRVIQGGSNRIEGSDILRGGNIVQTDQAIAIAKRAGASMLILGKVTSHQTAGSINGFTTVRLFDVATGQRVATLHRPSGMLMAYSEHQCVLKSAERVAQATAEALK